MKKIGKFLGGLAVATIAPLLSGCNWKLLYPAGYIAHEERTLIAICVGVMLCVVIPVMIAVVLFAIKYRASNKDAEYLPDWGHSNKIEAVMWGIPIVIVGILAVLTGLYTFKLEPSHELDSAVVSKDAPLHVEAVAMDWKWLFIYPEYGVASVNELYVPKDRQVFLQLTAENSINAFWVPRLGTILYAMPQMNAKLHLVANTEGVFEGMSANFSGDGFSDMKFKWHSVSDDAFLVWLNKVKSANATLDRAGYLKLAQHPGSEDVQGRLADSKVRYFSNVDSELYYRIVNACVVGNRECNERLMWRDAASSLWGQLCSVFNADYKVTN